MPLNIWETEGPSQTAYEIRGHVPAKDGHEGLENDLWLEVRRISEINPGKAVFIRTPPEVQSDRSYTTKEERFVGYARVVVFQDLLIDSIPLSHDT